VNLFRFIPGYEAQMVDTGREPVLLLLLAFLITFALTRLYTRLARKYGWGSGAVNGVHLHHMVVGIVFILVTGIAEIAWRPGTPAQELIAIIFGVGAALTLDEFALWLYLRDVYWSAEGRSSIDATVMGVVLAGLLLVGTAPFGVSTDSGEPLAVVFGMVAVNVVLSVVTFMKGKLTLGLISVFVPLVGLFAGVRLAKPGSLWARRFYGEHKLDAARTRFEDESWLNRLHLWFDDLVGGAPTLPMMPLRMEVVRGALRLRDEPDAGRA
jgi:hypothetical protein